MGDKEKNLVKKATEYFNSFAREHCDEFVFHDQIFMEDRLVMTREIAKGEGLQKDQYALGLVALILCDLGIKNAPDKKIDNNTLVKIFLENNVAEEEEKNRIWDYIDFLQSEKLGQNHLEKVLRDGKYIHLGMPDALERMELFRIEEERVKKRTYTELEWVEKCKQYFIKHSLDTRYANSRYGPSRSKNYMEMEKRLDKLRADDIKEIFSASI